MSQKNHIETKMGPILCYLLPPFFLCQVTDIVDCWTIMKSPNPPLLSDLLVPRSILIFTFRYPNQITSLVLTAQIEGGINIAHLSAPQPDLGSQIVEALTRMTSLLPALKIPQSNWR